MTDEKRYPFILQQLLQEQYPSVEVLNGGVPWYTSKHSLIGYVTYYEDLKPDLVIIMHAINDACRSFSPPDCAIGEYNELWTHFYGPAIRGAKAIPFEKHLLNCIETPSKAWYAKFRFIPKDFPLGRYISLGMYQKNMEKLIKCIKNNNSEIILLTEPSLYKEDMKKEEMAHLYFGRTIAETKVNFLQREYPSHKSFYKALQMFNKTVKEIAKKENIICIDTDNLLEKNLSNFQDDAHYTEKGAEQLAKIIAQYIIKHYEKLLSRGI